MNGLETFFVLIAAIFAIMVVACVYVSEKYGHKDGDKK